MKINMNNNNLLVIHKITFIHLLQPTMMVSHIIGIILRLSRSIIMWYWYEVILVIISPSINYGRECVTWFILWNKLISCWIWNTFLSYCLEALVSKPFSVLFLHKNDILIRAICCCWELIVKWHILW